MGSKGFVFIAAFALCCFAANVQAKLKCVQCGTISKAAQTDPMGAMKDIKEADACTKEIPALKECAADTDKFCVKLVGKSDLTARICYTAELKGCKDGVCPYSCTTDGCNSGENLNKNTFVLLLSAILSLLFAKCLST